MVQSCAIYDSFFQSFQNSKIQFFLSDFSLIFYHFHAKDTKVFVAKNQTCAFTYDIRKIVKTVT